MKTAFLWCCAVLVPVLLGQVPVHAFNRGSTSASQYRDPLESCNLNQTEKDAMKAALPFPSDSEVAQLTTAVNSLQPISVRPEDFNPQQCKPSPTERTAPSDDAASGTAARFPRQVDDIPPVKTFSHGCCHQDEYINGNRTEAPNTDDVPVYLWPGQYFHEVVCTFRYYCQDCCNDCLQQYRYVFAIVRGTPLPGWIDVSGLPLWTHSLFGFKGGFIKIPSCCDSVMTA